MFRVAEGYWYIPFESINQPAPTRRVTATTFLFLLPGRNLRQHINTSSSCCYHFSEKASILQPLPPKKQPLHIAPTLLTVLEYLLSSFPAHPSLVVDSIYILPLALHYLSPSILVPLLLRPPPGKEEKNNKKIAILTCIPLCPGDLLPFLRTPFFFFFSPPSLHLHVDFTELHAYRLFVRNFQAPFIRWSSIRFPR